MRVGQVARCEVVTRKDVVVTAPQQRSVEGQHKLLVNLSALQLYTQTTYLVQ